MGWAKRKVASAFRPELSFAIVDGILQVLMPSPIGERLETFPIGKEVTDTDPSGKQFVKVSQWVQGTLSTIATDSGGKTPVVVTTRAIRADDGALIQTCTAGAVSFERIFTRVDSVA